MKKLIYGIFLIFVISVAQAQEVCEDTFRQVAVRAAESCTGLQRDYLCHEGAENTRLIDVLAVQTPPANTEDSTYGVALMNVSAGLPLSIGEKGVMMLLLGDTRVENSVPAESAFTLAEPITVIAKDNVNLRSRANAESTVIGSARPGESLLADALSPDGSWLRVAVGDQPGWVFRELVEGDGINALPVISSEALTPMQQFTLVTGNSTGCAGMPDALVIQGMPTQPVTLQVNGASLTILKTVALQSESRIYSAFATDAAWREQYGQLLPQNAPSNDTVCHFMQLSTLDGEAYLNEYRLSIPEGHTALALNCDTDTDNYWDRAVLMTPRELIALEFLETLPDGVLRYPVEVPSPQEVVQQTAQIFAASVENTPVNSAGTNTALPAPVVGRPECPGFKATHPLNNIAFGFVRFYWDAAPGATSYRVNLINVRNELVVSFDTAGSETNVRVDTMSPALKDEPNSRTPFFFYEVMAFKDGNLMCYTPLELVQRDYDPDPDCPQHLWFSGTCEDRVANDD